VNPLRGHVQTVLGPVSPETLGPTLMHEHVLCDLTPPELAAQGCEIEIRLDNLFAIRHHWSRHYRHHILATATSLWTSAPRRGGSALVKPCEASRPSRRACLRGAPAPDCTSSPARSAVSLRARERASAAPNKPRRDDSSAPGLTARACVRIAAIGVSTLHRGRAPIVVAAALAQSATGARSCASAPHAGGTLKRSPCCARRGNTARSIISHVDRTLFTIDDMQCVADTGVVLEFDFFGIESAYYPFADIDLPNDGQRVHYIVELARRGYATQIVVSQDVCTRTRLTRYGGHGYAHLLDNAVPLMRRRGLADDDLHQILVRTPRRLLALV
jgi:phosphotriesterase-related protein